MPNQYIKGKTDHLKCAKHPLAHVIVTCPACTGSTPSKAKAASSRINGTKGGRPKKK